MCAEALPTPGHGTRLPASPLPLQPARTSSSAVLAAMGKVSKMKSSSLTPCSAGGAGGQHARQQQVGRRPAGQARERSTALQGRVQAPALASTYARTATGPSLDAMFLRAMWYRPSAARRPATASSQSARK